MTRCYLGLGSNLSTPTRQLNQAVNALRKLPQTMITGQSRIYLSQPLGIRAQPTYCNMVIALQTKLPPFRLLYYCQAIEKQQQRIRKKHWGARTLDIDVLLYGNQSIHTHHLTIPHPHMLNRDFVLIPLVELEPELHLPNGQRVNEYLTTCKTHVIPIHG